MIELLCSIHNKAENDDLPNTSGILVWDGGILMIGNILVTGSLESLIGEMVNPLD